MPSEIEVPRRQENEYQVHQRAAAQQHEGRLNQASETAAAPALRQFVAKCVAAAHGMGRVVPNIFSAPGNQYLEKRYKGHLSYQRGVCCGSSPQASLTCRSRWICRNVPP